MGENPYLCPPMKPEIAYAPLSDSRLIDWLRLPLTLLVLFNHTHLFPEAKSVGITLAHTPIFHTLYRLLSLHLPYLTVPLFFLFSGYLFFRDAEPMREGLWREKLGRRGHTLLLPYLLWNLLTLIALAFGEYLFGGLQNGHHLAVSEYSFGDWLSAFWITAKSSYSPICPPLWYMRDLMLVMLLAVPLYPLLKRTGFLLPALFGAAWVATSYNYAPINGFSLIALFFFLLGASFAVRRVSFAPLFASLRWPATVGYLLLLALLFFFGGYGDWVGSLFNLSVIFGIVALGGWVTRLLERSKHSAPTSWAALSFFIYAAHYYLLLLLMRLSLRLLHPESDWALLLLYLALPLTTALLLTAIYRLLHRLTPSLLALLTGSRNKKTA